MMYTKGENPMVVDTGNEPGVVDICDDCGAAIYEEDIYYDVRGRTLCDRCGLGWFNEKYGRFAE